MKRRKTVPCGREVTPSSLHLALALIRIPHLALSLFVVPLFIGLLLVTAQLLVTGTLLLISNPRLVTAQRRPLRQIVMGILFGLFSTAITLFAHRLLYAVGK